MPRLHIRLGLYVLGALIAALILAWGAKVALAALEPRGLSLALPPQLAGLLPNRGSVARVLAQPPTPGKTIELDAYYSGAGAGRAPLAAAACDADPYAVLSDRPFKPELTVLGAGQANAPAGEGAWLIAVAPGAGSSLPYRARLRGHLAAAGEQGCASSGHVFVVERVVHIYAERPPQASAAADPGGWPRHQDAEATCSVPCPPGWHVEQVDAGTLMLYDPQQPSSAVLLRVHQGETHHDPYDPKALPPLLQGQEWRVFDQREALGVAVQGLLGYRVQAAGEAGQRSVSVLFSGHGRTYELSLGYSLGLEAPQPVLSAYSAIVAGFTLEAPLEPSPTPPVQQTLGAGPFLSQEEALQAACGCLDQQIDESLDLRLVSEAEARQLGGSCGSFVGHTGGVWALTLRTPLAERTQTLRLLVDGMSGRELCRQEIEAGAVPEPVAEQPDERPKRWIEVNLGQQTVTAWEGDTAVRQFNVSTGTALHPTVTGNFHVYYKTRSMTMSGPDYVLPGVPNVMFFFEGYALHGAYWHFSFGTRISHGCVNMTIPDSAWLFDWAGPRLAEDEWAVTSTVCNPGTLVVVH